MDEKPSDKTAAWALPVAIAIAALASVLYLGAGAAGPDTHGGASPSTTSGSTRSMRARSRRRSLAYNRVSTRPARRARSGRFCSRRRTCWASRRSPMRSSSASFSRRWRRGPERASPRPLEMRARESASPRPSAHALLRLRGVSGTRCPCSSSGPDRDRPCAPRRGRPPASRGPGDPGQTGGARPGWDDRAGDRDRAAGEGTLRARSRERGRKADRGAPTSPGGGETWTARTGPLPRVAAFLAPALAVIAPWIIYCVAVSGRPLPATFYAKAHAFGPLNPSQFQRIGALLTGQPFFGSSLGTAVAVTGALIGAWSSRSERFGAHASGDRRSCSSGSSGGSSSTPSRWSHPSASRGRPTRRGRCGTSTSRATCCRPGAAPAPLHDRPRGALATRPCARRGSRRPGAVTLCASCCCRSSRSSTARAPARHLLLELS